MSTAQDPPQTPARLGPPDAAPRADAADGTSAYEEQIAGIVDRLQQRYPRAAVSGLDLEGRVRGAYRQFDSARVRTFVTILVERLVRRSIEEPSLAMPNPVAAPSGLRPPWRGSRRTRQHVPST